MRTDYPCFIVMSDESSGEMKPQTAQPAVVIRRPRASADAPMNNLHSENPGSPDPVDGPGPETAEDLNPVSNMSIPCSIFRVVGDIVRAKSCVGRCFWDLSPCNRIMKLIVRYTVARLRRVQ